MRHAYADICCHYGTLLLPLFSPCHFHAATYAARGVQRERLLLPPLFRYASATRLQALLIDDDARC